MKTRSQQQLRRAKIGSFIFNTRYIDPKGKSVSDHFKLIFNQRHEEKKNNCNASGISEEQTNLDDPPDDLLHQRNALEEERREKRTR